MFTLVEVYSRIVALPLAALFDLFDPGKSLEGCSMLTEDSMQVLLISSIMGFIMVAGRT